MPQNQDDITDLLVLRIHRFLNCFLQTEKSKCYCHEDFFPILLLPTHFKGQSLINTHFRKDWNFEEKKSENFHAQWPRDWHCIHTTQGLGSSDKFGFLLSGKPSKGANHLIFIAHQKHRLSCNTTTDSLWLELCL